MNDQPKYSFVAGVLLFTAAFMLSAARLAVAQAPDQGPGGPILVVSSPGNAFTNYTAEILRAEGLNAFAVASLSTVSPGVLAGYDVVILGQMPLSPAQVTMFSDWVTAGGNLIAMRPDKQLYGLLGLTDLASTVSNAYLLVNTGAGPGRGIVNQSIQFHGTADLSSATTASVVAALYSNATTATASPAVTLRGVGTSGGQAAAFLFDLPRSVVYTRQGNPAWAGQPRDGASPIRSHDLFFGAASFDPQPDWVNLNKVEIPQADEQQRLLANLILQMNADRKPLPRFWYFPRGEKAVVVMTGDDHAVGGTFERFEQYKAFSPAGCSVDDWECIRSTSYIYTNTPLSDAQAAAFTAEGFEVSIHVETGCADWASFADLGNRYATQLSAWKAKYRSVPSPATHRMHCIVWSDWASQPKVERQNGIALDTTYYYWPGSWVQNRPGFFTGSGMPMRYADVDGTILDVYQATSQMNDENAQTYPFTIDALLDKAIGPDGYYGAFTANMHTDYNNNPAEERLSMAKSNAIVASAQLRGVPVVSARQMLDWLNGRNGSSFGSIAWNAATSVLSFTVSAPASARGLQAMLPYRRGSLTLGGVTVNGSPVAFSIETIKGIEYATFAAQSGTYTAGYVSDSTAPIISSLAAVATGPSTAVITWNTNEPADSRVSYGVSAGALTSTAADGAFALHHTIALVGLSPNTTYQYRVTSSDGSGNTATSPAPPATGTFTTSQPTFVDTTVADFTAGTVSGAAVTNVVNGEIALAPSAAEEFSGAALPAGWSGGPFATGGSVAVAGGLLTVDGARATTDATYGPGRSLEFVATFGAAPFQHAGFAADQDFNAPWAIFSTASTTNSLFARTSAGVNTLIPGSWLNAPHRYRIDWNANGIVFFVDGAQVASLAPIAGTMRPAISDLEVGGATLAVDWLRLTPPHVPSGSFDSRVFDAGMTAGWGALSWTADSPAGTAITLSVRTGGTPIPDGAWTAFRPISPSGATIGGASRYIQYRAALTTSDTASSPLLHDVTIGYGSAPPLAASDGFSLNEDGALTSPAPGVLANDSDPAGRPLTAVLVNGPANAASFSMSADGSFSYTPTVNFNGTDTFTYKANNGTDDSNVATVTLTINAVNDVPSFTKGANRTTTEDAGIQSVAGWATNVSAGPANEASQTVSFLVSNNNPALFSAQPAVAANGTLTYTSAPNANGVATVTVQVRDSGGTANGGIDTSAPQTFTITVTTVNDAPLPVPDAKSATQGVPVSFSANGLAANDTPGPANETGQTLTVTAVDGTASTHGTVFMIGDQVTYTSDASFTGTASFQYTVCDNGTTNGVADPKCSVGIVNVTVSPLLGH
jgi:hypothetical protein